MYENKKTDILEAQKGSQEKMQMLVDNNNGLIWSIVKRFKDRGHEMEDLYQIGCIGLIKAIKRFDTSFDVKLSTYAVPYILGEIKRYIRDDGLLKVSRSVKELATKIKDIQKKALTEGKEISIIQIAEKLHITKEEVAIALDAMKPVESINEDVYQENSKTKLIDQISSGKDEATELIDSLSLKTLVDNLEIREKELILLRYYKGQTQAQVAKVLNITQVQVSRIEKRILNTMRLKMLG